MCLSKWINRSLFIFFALSITQTFAKTEKVEMHSLTSNGIGPVIGTIDITETRWGLLFTPHLKGLKLGIHGFHVHQYPNCSPAKKDGTMVAGLAAGGHYDPQHTDKHLGPYGNGHLGDLPVLYADFNGQATLPVLAPRIKSLSQIQGRSLMIHSGGDNYSDNPPLGGGGSRFACGVIN